MAEILAFDPTRRAKPPVPGTPAPADITDGISLVALSFGYDQQRSLYDREFIESNPDALEIAAARVQDMKVALFVRQQISVASRRVAKNREAIHSMRFERFLGEIMLSERGDWARNPTIYGAYVLEYYARLHQVGLMMRLAPA